MTPTDRDWHMHMVPDMPDEFDERLHEHDEPDEGDGAGAIKWAFWIGVFYIAIFGVLKFTGVI